MAEITVNNAGTRSRILQGLYESFWRDDSLRFPVLVFLAVRALTWIGILIMAQLPPVSPPVWLGWNPSGQTYVQALPFNSPLAGLVEPWHRWDTAWYVKIAIQGYRPGDPAIVFPPFYPVLIGLLAPLTGNNYVLASLIISNVACLFALILLYKLVVHEFSDRYDTEEGAQTLARRTLLLLAAFPTAFYMVAGYTEPLFLAFTLGAFLLAFKKNWLWCGILAFMAALVRLQGATLCLPLGWIAYIQLRDRGWRNLVDRLPALIGAPLGTGCYLLYLAFNHMGALDAAYWNEWQLSTQPPWVSIIAFWQRLTTGMVLDFEWRNLFALILLVIFSVIVTVKFKFAYTLYVWPTLVLLLLRYHAGPQFESMIRYSLLMFPCFIVAAMLIKRWWWIWVYVAAAGFWQITLLNDFTHWIWVA